MLGAKKGTPMLHYSIAFAVMALIAACFGFSGIANDIAQFARLMFFIFLSITLVSIAADVFYFN